MNRRIFRGLLGLAVLVLTLLVGALPAAAAETVHLFLKVDGQPVAGDSTQTSLGRAGSIECTSFEQTVAAGEKGREYAPVKCVKRLDKSSPLLLRALIERRPVEATFKFYRPNPSGDGTTEQFYTIELKKAVITGYRLYVPDTMSPATSSLPPMEEVTITFGAISWTYTNGNTTTSDGMPTERTR